jgi:hypothetical protein
MRVSASVLRPFLAGLAVIGLGACARPLPPSDPAMIAVWMKNYYGLIRAERLSPPVASRVLAYAAAGLYEGLAAATPGLRSLAGQVNGLTELPRPSAGKTYDPELIALASERMVLDTLFREGLPATKAALEGLSDSLVASRIAAGIPADVQERSEELGQRIGAAVLAWSAQDGFDATRLRPWKPPLGPQYWLNDTPPEEFTAQNLSAATDFVALDNPADTLKAGSASERSLVVNRPKAGDIRTLKAVNPAGATEPWWGTLRPFVMKAPDECAAPPPPEFGTTPGSPIFEEAKRVRDVGRALTEEQRLIALYWADNPGQTGTPIGHWLSIGSQMVSGQKLAVEQAAELFVLVSLAQADAFIGVWQGKYHWNLIRPRTYIRRHLDPTWEPLIVTPTFPEHPAGHGGQSAAASTVMTGLLGDIAFDDSTNLSLGHPVRHFASFQAAADEAAMSRLFGGIHYTTGNEAGKLVGRCVGEKVLQRLKTRSEGTR